MTELGAKPPVLPLGNEWQLRHAKTGPRTAKAGGLRKVTRRIQIGETPRTIKSPALRHAGGPARARPMMAGTLAMFPAGETMNSSEASLDLLHDLIGRARRAGADAADGILVEGVSIS